MTRQGEMEEEEDGGGGVGDTETPDTPLIPISALCCSRTTDTFTALPNEQLPPAAAAGTCQK